MNLKILLSTLIERDYCKEILKRERDKSYCKCTFSHGIQSEIVLSFSYIEKLLFPILLSNCHSPSVKPFFFVWSDDSTQIDNQSKLQKEKIQGTTERSRIF